MSDQVIISLLDSEDSDDDITTGGADHEMKTNALPRKKDRSVSTSKSSSSISYTSIRDVSPKIAKIGSKSVHNSTNSVNNKYANNSYHNNLTDNNNSNPSNTNKTKNSEDCIETDCKEPQWIANEKHLLSIREKHKREMTVASILQHFDTFNVQSNINIKQSSLQIVSPSKSKTKTKTTSNSANQENYLTLIKNNVERYFSENLENKSFVIIEKIQVRKIIDVISLSDDESQEIGKENNKHGINNNKQVSKKTEQKKSESKTPTPTKPPKPKPHQKTTPERAQRPSNPPKLATPEPPLLPAQLNTPSVPLTPTKPLAPARPVKPLKPGSPAKSGTPSRPPPPSSSRPFKPATPSKPNARSIGNNNSNNNNDNKTNDNSNGNETIVIEDSLSPAPPLMKGNLKTVSNGVKNSCTVGKSKNMKKKRNKTIYDTSHTRQKRWLNREIVDSTLTVRNMQHIFSPLFSMNAKDLKMTIKHILGSMENVIFNQHLNIDYQTLSC